MSREVWRSLQQPATCCPNVGQLGMALSALNHWKACGGDLSRAMDTISSGENVLETIFSFQPEQVEVFVNTEGADPTDIGLRMCPEDGGFEVNVIHRETQQTTSATREVRRAYSFHRPLYWDQAKASISAEGVIHLVIPGPLLQPFPMEHCF